MLDIPPNVTTEDVKLSFCIETASRWIEEILNRPGLSYASRTEYYRGTGTNKLLLRSRPVFTTPTIQVYEDEAGYYGSGDDAFNSDTLLEYGVDYCLQIDQDDGSSRSGILLNIKGAWPRRYVRQRGLLTPYLGDDLGSIKCIYTAGHTVDTLPAVFRTAVDMLVGKLYYILPLAMEISSESYEERSISFAVPDKTKNYLTSLVIPMIIWYRNWSF